MFDIIIYPLLMIVGVFLLSRWAVNKELNRPLTPEERVKYAAEIKAIEDKRAELVAQLEAAKQEAASAAK